MEDFEILRGDPLEVIKQVERSSLKQFVYITAPVDEDFFLNHLKPNLVGLTFNKGPYLLKRNGAIEEITTGDYADGYELAGAFFLEKDILLKYLDTGVLPLEKLTGIPLPKKNEGEKRPALFLDRDGVINDDKNYVHKAEQVTFYEGIVDIIKFANEKDWYVVVLTNQSGVGRGMFSEDEVKNLHSYMSAELKKKGAIVDDWFFCPYHHAHGVGEYKKYSFMRKPYPGMALKACEKYPIDLDKSFMIGDKVTDELFIPGLRPIHITRGSDLSKAQAPVFKTYVEILNYLKAST
ncbi:MAG: HAD family hydrolase [Deltaproteobacteria bacterium]|nr:MAG: HAD family hydrolase [Deltaproteobacteria bacterium]